MQTTELTEEIQSSTEKCNHCLLRASLNFPRCSLWFVFVFPDSQTSTVDHVTKLGLGNEETQTKLGLGNECYSIGVKSRAMPLRIFVMNHWRRKLSNVIGIALTKRWFSSCQSRAAKSAS